MKRELEICIDEPESAFAAIAGGADRLEVCASLEVGGLTPSASLIKLLDRESSIPLHVMIRPRSGGFVYSRNERELMVQDIRSSAEWGVVGVVFGALTSAGQVDFDFVEELVGAAGELHCTFHRAIDCVEPPSSVLNRLAQLGIGRVLSSGGSNTAIEGATELATMRELAPSGLQLMAGAGIHSGNLKELLERTGVEHVHGSAAKDLPTTDHLSPNRLSFCDQSDGLPVRRRTSVAEVRALRSILDGTN